MRERERERERGSMREAGEEREGERTPSRLCTLSLEPNEELELTNCEFMTRARIKSCMLNRMSHPGDPP